MRDILNAWPPFAAFLARKSRVALSRAIGVPAEKAVMSLIVAVPILARILKSDRIGVDVAARNNHHPREIAMHVDGIGRISARHLADGCTVGVEDQHVELVVVLGRVRFLVLHHVHGAPPWCIASRVHRRV